MIEIFILALTFYTNTYIVEFATNLRIERYKSFR